MGAVADLTAFARAYEDRTRADRGLFVDEFFVDAFRSGAFARAAPT